jgi:hypothetical protein
MTGLFRDRLLCDVTVVVGATEFKAHAVVRDFSGHIVNSDLARRRVRACSLLMRHR